MKSAEQQNINKVFEKSQKKLDSYLKNTQKEEKERLFEKMDKLEIEGPTINDLITEK